MTHYSYKALTPSGDVITGTSDAGREDELRQQIEARGLIVVEVNAENGFENARNLDWRRWFRPQASEKHVTEFLQHLAVLLQASIRLDHALDLLGYKELAGPMLEPVRDIRRAILSGDSLSHALSRHRDLFPPSLCALVALSEQSGSLADTISAIAIERERTEKLRQKAIDSLTYPIFLLAAVTAVLIFFITFVLPQFKPIIADLGQKADPLLLMLLDFSSALEQNRTETLGLIALVITILVMILKNKDRRHAIADWFLQAPGLRDIDRDYRTARFCRNFSHLVERGISLSDAVDLTGKAVASAKGMARFALAREEIRQGHRIFDALEKTDALSPVALRMLRIGEETGRVPMIAMKAAELFETRVERQLEKLVGLIGPIAILVVSLVVGGLIVSVMTALMSINEMVR